MIIFVDTNSPNYTDFPVAEIEKIDQAIFDHHIPQFKLKQVIFEYSNLQYSSAAEIVLNI
ncbi:MAG: DHH family phosphoesterase [Mollicutes bacterium]|nr:MAG: DHH family phosphoesterase [Mollicutes bacterium]